MAIWFLGTLQPQPALDGYYDITDIITHGYPSSAHLGIH